MNSPFLRRMVEAFFRRGLFYAALFLLCLWLGRANLSDAQNSYTSSGSMFVEARSLIAAQSGLDFDSSLTRLTPAGFAVGELNGIVSTRSFMEAVAERAEIELAEDAQTRMDQLFNLRLSFFIEPESDNIAAFYVTTEDPELSQRIAQAVFEEFLRFQISVAVAQSASSEDFFSQVASTRAATLVAARVEVDGFLADVEFVEDLFPEQELELQDLRAAEAVAVAQFQEATDGVESSRLVTLRAETDVGQRYSIVDFPDVPVEVDAVGLLTYLSMAMFGLIGVLLAMLGPMVSALRDSTVLFPEDLDPDPGLPILAVVPKVSRKRLAAPSFDGRRSTTPQPDGALVSARSTAGTRRTTKAEDSS